MRYKQSNPKCGEVTIPQNDKIQGKNSDLHIYVSYTNYENDDYLAAASWCQFVDGLGPTHGEVNFNLNLMGKKNINDPIEFEVLMELLIHEITHILGFSNLDIPKWITHNKTLHIEPTIIKSIRGVEYLLIKTPNILQFARQYFGCPTLIGMPLDFSDDFRSADSHWKSTDIQNEYMNSFTSTTQAYYSGFTANLLRDTGFYFQINAFMEEKTFYGKGAGCEHILGKCNPSAKEYCDSKNDQDLCDFYHHGSSICKVGYQNDADCNYFKQLREFKMLGQIKQCMQCKNLDKFWSQIWD
ncbi:leishmanolysin family protein, putative [Ichthyophthirius multifiliis]|uniref:Leishmanolysin family protein, putative n=1 Tax=Ichthyophthirius multifiliis TaxID=5932 RepID=G0R6M3_ICHMU|nr:leishmanolysin family protein, putative [Ichthyophthirius multifiliis]EGR26890.1 leishmanolysin family protein, putative [Ichthyophthirius multifiliis]|eukprot:XP_004023774.1 leishmanolysin family protein, putative [Ichthyophthirius multifiliis]